MEQVTQNTNLFTPRDYDKDPIVIKDDTRKLSLFLFIFSMFIMYLAGLMYPNSHFTQTNLIISISIFVLPVLYKSLPLINDKNEVILSGNQIVRQWGKSEIGIRWSSNIIIEKSFIDFFDKQQADASWQRYLCAIFNILLNHPFSFIAKPIYYLLKNGLEEYRFFDTFIIRDGEEMIAILITNKQDYELLKEFLFVKGVDIDQISVFYTPFYLSLESATKDK